MTVEEIRELWDQYDVEHDSPAEVREKFQNNWYDLVQIILRLDAELKYAEAKRKRGAQ